MVRTFKKPILTKNIPLEVNTERNIPMPSRFMKGMPDIPKEQTEREKYLARLNAQIYQKEREWEEKQALVAANTVALDESFRKHAENLTNQIQELESQLVLKRTERKELEKPFEDRKRVLDERETTILKREEAASEKEQELFQKERSYEIKLDSIKDLSDQVSEARLTLTIREKKIEAKENALSRREMEYLVAVQNLKEQEISIRNAFQTREYAVALKELSVQSKEENLVQREQKLLEGNIRLTDQRDVLARAWKEVEQKKHGNHAK